jgi:truncated hemoglobin YjbI
VLAGIERIDEIVNAFYQRVPASMVVDGVIPTCAVSGTILRREAFGEPRH